MVLLVSTNKTRIPATQELFHMGGEETKVSATSFFYRAQYLKP